MLPEEPDIVSAHDDGDDAPHRARAVRWAGGHRVVRWIADRRAVRWVGDRRAVRWAASHRGLAAAAAVVVVAGVAAGIATVVAPGQHAVPVPGTPGLLLPEVIPGGVTTAAPIGIFNTFADGFADGQAWQLTVQNVATDGRACLPAVVLSGAYGDLLFPGTDLGLTAAGAPSLISGEPDPGVSFAFFRVPAAVRRLRVTIGTAPPLTISPAVENECGRMFRLAGFGFMSAAHVTVTALTGDGAAGSYTLPNSLIRLPGNAASAGGWRNLGSGTGPGSGDGTGWGSPELIDRARADGATWGITVARGSYGECFSLTRGALRAVVSPVCVPVNPTGADPSAEILTAPASSAEGIALAVSNDVALVVANLPGGKTARVSPVDIGGRYYAGLITAARPSSLAAYNPNGGVIDTIRFPPGPG